MLKQFFAVAALLSTIGVAQALDQDASDGIIMDSSGASNFTCSFSSRVYALDKPFKAVSTSCESACAQAKRQCESIGVGDCVKVKCEAVSSDDEAIPSHL